MRFFMCLLYWEMKDSNLRRLQPFDLQSTSFNHLDNLPKKSRSISQNLPTDLPYALPESSRIGQYSSKLSRGFTISANPCMYQFFFSFFTSFFSMRISSISTLTTFGKSLTSLCGRILSRARRNASHLAN